MTDIFKIIVIYRRKIIAKYRIAIYHLVGTELKSHKNVMESFFKIKTFKSLKEVVESFFNIKNFRNHKKVMKSFYGIKNFKTVMESFFQC